MRIFLTGGSGFVGAETLRLLLAARHDVAVLLREPSRARRIRDCLGRCRVVQGDFKDVGAWREVLMSFQPEAVMHTGWHGVRNGQRNDLDQIQNVPAVLDLVEAAAEAGAKHWVGMGSQAEYGPCHARISEAHPTRPTTLYGVSKLCAGLAAARACAERNMRFAWVRLFSSYGPDDDPSWMIPYVSLSLLRGERPALTRGEQHWDYVFVRDVAQALVKVVETPTAEGAFNLGSGMARPLREIIETLRDIIDPCLQLGFGEIPYRSDQVMHLEADTSRLRQATGWRPQVSLLAGLTETVCWYREHRHEWNRTTGV